MITSPGHSKDYVDDTITLEILSAVEEDSRVTQRSLSNSLGIALGLTNSYVKRSLKKGLIKIITAPANRYAYYLTPKGFSEKSRLTKEFLSQSFKFFRAAREQCVEIIDLCIEREWNSVLLVGAGDLCEIAILSAHERGLCIVGIFDPSWDSREFCGFSVCTDVAKLPSFDAVIMLDMGLTPNLVHNFEDVIGSHRILIPKILGFKRAGHSAISEGGHG